MPLLQTFGNATARAWRRYGPTSAAADYELISTTILSSSAASVTFSGLGTSAAAYKHLQLRMTTRSTYAAQWDSGAIQYNGDTGSNYSLHALGGVGSSVYSEGGSSAARTFFNGGALAGANNAANLFTATVVDILDFSSTSKNKTHRSFNGGSGSEYRVGLHSGAWYSTSAITSILLYSSSGSNFVTGSRFSLYGLK